MGFPPKKEPAKTTVLLIAVLLGGCIPFSTPYSVPETPQVERFPSSIGETACGQLDFTPPFVNISGTIALRPSSATSLLLYIAPNLTVEAADHVLHHCARIGTIWVDSGANFSLLGLPLGQYFLAAAIPDNETEPGMSFLIHRDRTQRVEILWTRTIDSCFVVAMEIENEQVEAP